MSIRTVLRAAVLAMLAVFLIQAPVRTSQGGDMVRVGGMSYGIDIKKPIGQRILDMTLLRTGKSVERVIGGLLVITGVLFMTGSMNDIAFWILEIFPTLGRIG